jgi:hypothetical protein
MKGIFRLLALATVCVLGSAVPVRALGPVDLEVTDPVLEPDTEVLGVSEASGDVGARAEMWITRFGVSASFYQYTPEDSLSSLDFQYTNLDAKWKLISPTENNFFALGVGYQKIDLDSSGFSDSSEGPRLVAEGRVGLTNLLYFYGRGAYMPDLPISTRAWGRHRRLGHSTSLAWVGEALPSSSSSEATASTDEYETGIGNTEFKHDGLVAGAGVNF